MRRIVSATCALFFSVACEARDEEATDSGELQRLSVLIDNTPFSAVSGGAVRSGSTVTLTGIAQGGGMLKTLTIIVSQEAPGAVEIGGPGSPTITYTEQPTGGGAMKQWTAGEGLGSGTIVFTEFSAIKVVGTLVASLPSLTATGATGAKVLTSGTFRLFFSAP